MSRTMTPAAALQCVAPQIQVAIFAKLQFKDTTQYVWTGRGSITWDGNTFLGLGAFAKVGVISEDTQLNAQGVELTLSGIDSTLLPEALSQIQQGLPVLLWLAFFDSAGAIIVDPILCFAGRMDQPVIDESGETSTITINCENRLADLQRRLVRRFTDQDQRMDWPRDTGFAWVSQLMDWTSAWGVPSTNIAP